MYVIYSTRICAETSFTFALYRGYTMYIDSMCTVQLQKAEKRFAETKTVVKVRTAKLQWNMYTLTLRGFLFWAWSPWSLERNNMEHAGCRGKKNMRGKWHRIKPCTVKTSKPLKIPHKNYNRDYDNLA